ncbi:Spherulation-specific family 4 [Penicillium chermesinum]|uniref:Spherulation-specific family 4 n=1 Tax=Penicillium chermesinum TaxID=63820 RepID=A0A9W9NWW1_9EURO|nr:Spherulation-specific family 4 [Penicillium chermesinum]KAJ5226134.1 Spherulation-specific family 4 [Penicillium chermesinum]KAJ6160681.1 Spherulation-specific family 4 [Penicillium chermesinum]
MRVLSSLMGGALAIASMVSSTSILIPLYVWPEDDSTWGPVYNAAAAHPNIQFQVIINPSSGPGSSGKSHPPIKSTWFKHLTLRYSEYPDESYISAVAKLNNYSNVQTLGYVDTQFTTRDVSDVENDVSIYQGWSSYKNSNITISGIFFDDAPNENNEAKISYMQQISSTAKSSNMRFVVFNPGTTLQSGSAKGYFDAADLIVEFENTYSTWISSTPADHFSGKADYSKDAIILYNAPLAADYDAVVKEATQMGLGAAYLTNDDDYSSVASVQKVIQAFVDAA